jgi:hypothetical protein
MKKVFSIKTIIFLSQAGLAIGLGMYIGALWRMRATQEHSHDHNHGQGAVATDTTHVRVSTRREGDVTRVYVQNLERSEITMTFEFNVVNLKSEVEFPYTATFGPGETQAFTLSPDDPSRKWEFSYTNYYKLGSMLAVPDGYLYSLPYAPGSSHKVTQAFGGSYSHTGSNKYAIDWKMPSRTPMWAAAA